IQFLKLAALALPPDPALLVLAPDTSAMEQQEPVTGSRRPVSPVQARNAGDRRFEELPVTFDLLRKGIRPVGQQREMDLAVRIAEVEDFQFLDLLLDRLTRRQQGRHHHDRAQLWRNAVAQREARQYRRAVSARHGAVDERKR